MVVALEPIVVRTGAVTIQSHAFGKPVFQAERSVDYLQDIGLDGSVNGLQRLPEQLCHALADNLLSHVDLFRQWDGNGDGVVTCPEFVEALRQLGLTNVPESLLEQAYHALDANGDGFLHYEELHSALVRRSRLSVQHAEEETASLHLPAALRAALQLMSNARHTHPLPGVRSVLIDTSELVKPAVAQALSPADMRLAKLAKVSPAQRHAVLLAAARTRGFYRAYPSLPHCGAACGRSHALHHVRLGRDALAGEQREQRRAIGVVKSSVRPRSRRQADRRGVHPCQRWQPSAAARKWI